MRGPGKELCRCVCVWDGTLWFSGVWWLEVAVLDSGRSLFSLARLFPVSTAPGWSPSLP